MTIAASLDSYLRDCQRREFDWRVFNCAHFVAEWVQRCEHRDVVIPETLRGNVELRNEVGSTPDAVTAVLRREPINNWKLAQVGDVVYSPSKRAGRGYLGICCGRECAFLSQSDSSVVLVSMSGVTHVWHIEEGV